MSISPSIHCPGGIFQVPEGHLILSQEYLAPCASSTKITFPQTNDPFELQNKSILSWGSLQTADLSQAHIKIGEQNFRNCIKLNSILLGPNVLSAGTGSFVEAADSMILTTTSPYVKYVETFFLMSESLIVWVKKDVTTPNLPVAATRIGYLSFHKCSKLIEVNISQGITAIDEGAFATCSQLIRFNVEPNGNEIRTQYEGKLLLVKNLVISSCTSLDGNISIEKGITTICRNSLQNTKITAITIPKTVRFIDHFAFFQCLQLHALILPSFLRNISGTAFSSSGIQEIWFKGTIRNDKDLQDSLTNIGSSLVKVTITCKQKLEPTLVNSTGEVIRYCGTPKFTQKHKSRNSKFILFLHMLRV